MGNYLISIKDHKSSENKSVIHDPKSKLKVNAFNAVSSKFKPNKKEVQYFVTAGNETLAFETEGYKKHRHLLILHMVARYCVYMGLVGAQIHSTLPAFK